MRLSVKYKLFLTLLLATGVVAAGMMAVMTWSFEQGFVRFVSAQQQERIESLAAHLSDVYRREGGWGGLRGNRPRWIGLLMRSRSFHPEGAGAPWYENAYGDPRQWSPPTWSERWDSRYRHGPVEDRIMLLDAQKRVIFGLPGQVSQPDYYAIESDGATVGYLGVLPGPAFERLGEVRFLEQQSNTFALIALAAVLLSAALALPLANRMMRPLRAFAAASRDLAAGRYGTRIPVESGDELGQLARDFNELAAALERTERQRRQWVADISHELRTPLAVVRGELEALQDGVRPLSRQAVDSLHADILRLGRLVNDLYELSMSDMGALDYRKTRVDAVAVLKDDIAHFSAEFERAHINVELRQPLTTPVSLYADPDRLSQLFHNLLSNTLRYTDAGGVLRVTLARTMDRLTIDFEDSNPGVADDDLRHLFERFYRVESSRSRAHGGAGLGLAICRNIVEAHNGQIRASASPLGGLRVSVELPL